MTPTGIHQDDLVREGRKVLRRDGKQILLIAREGSIYAIANRCPHEGYPLSEGTLNGAQSGGEPLHTSPDRASGPGCVLTCNWHNWKFDLATGEALVGRDPVRTYPVEVKNGEIFLDLRDSPAEARRARALKGLETALADNDFARMAREVVRLDRAGFAMTDALVYAIAVCNDRLEDGMTHAYGAAADWLKLSDVAPTAEARLAALLEPIAHLAWDTEGVGGFPYAEGTTPWDAKAFFMAVEGEREVDAIARIRGAVAQGVSYDQLSPALGEAALAHYADFGHSAIYTINTGELIARLGGVAREPLLLALTRQLVRATREERLPEFRFYDKALGAWDNSGNDMARAQDFVGLSIDGALKRALRSSGRPPREIYDALLGAAAWNFLHFDLAIDQASDNALADNVSWLDFTHALTFASACRRICEQRPGLWPKALLQMALFVGRNQKYVTADEDVSGWRVNDPQAFIAREMNALYDHGIVEPIIACHRVKMLFALKCESEAAPDAPWIADMSAAMNRYLHTPMKRHHGLRTAAQALDFIAKEA
ncbi:MAG: Rieske 2Fe-2S domain-containing protein [Proteobacteria bacterium]|nr:Rieske 2Fe-2S domain-containing protein [Pseudomonadota bacterium]